MMSIKEETEYNGKDLNFRARLPLNPSFSTHQLCGLGKIIQLLCASALRSDTEYLLHRDITKIKYAVYMQSALNSAWQIVRAQ